MLQKASQYKKAAKARTGAFSLLESSSVQTQLPSMSTTISGGKWKENNMATSLAHNGGKLLTILGLSLFSLVSGIAYRKGLISCCSRRTHSNRRKRRDTPPDVYSFGKPKYNYHEGSMHDVVGSRDAWNERKSHVH